MRALPTPSTSSELAGDEGFAAAGAVGGDGEAVGLVADALEVVEDRVARGELEGVAAGHVEPLAAGVAVGALGNADDGDLVQA